MKTRATDSDYLRRRDPTWSGAKSATPSVGSSGIGDTDYIHFGKGYWQSTGPAENYALYQAFCRFDLSGIPDSHAIDSAMLRLYLEVQSTWGGQTEQTFTIVLSVLDATYGTVDATDWGAAGTTTTLSSSNRTTDHTGQEYIDIPLSAAQVALLTTTGTVDILLRGDDETTTPNELENLRAFAHGYATETLRPYLKVITKDRKMQILDAAIAKLGEIDEFSGYESSPKTVTAEYKLLEEMSEPEFPCIFPIVDDEPVLEGTLGLERRRADFTFIAAIWNADKGLRAQNLLALQRDIKRVIYANPQLGLTAFVIETRIPSVETGFLYVADDFRAASAVHIEVSYTEDPYES